MSEKFKLFEAITTYKQLPTHIWSKDCFCCGTENNRGLHMDFYSSGKYLLSTLTIPGEMRGWDTIVHGGILSTIMDEIMAWTAIFFTEKITFTKQMQTSFIHPIQINSSIKLISWIESNNGKEAKIKAEIYDSNGKLSTEGLGTYVLFSEKLATKLKMMGEESIINFKKFIDASKSILPPSHKHENT